MPPPTEHFWSSAARSSACSRRFASASTFVSRTTPGPGGVPRGILRCMVKSVEGIYRNGKVELLEPLAEAEGSRVVVTWVHPAAPLDLRERGIDESQAADLRRRLAPFAEGWDRPEMAAYDKLPAR